MAMAMDIDTLHTQIRFFRHELQRYGVEYTQKDVTHEDSDRGRRGSRFHRDHQQ